MRFFATAAKIRAASVISLLLAGGATLAQASPQERIVRVETDGSSYLGIQMEDVSSSNMAKYKLTAERGVIVKSVESGSPAESAKLQENDVITEFAGMPVISTTQLSRLVKETPPGRKVEIVVSRDGKRTSLTAEIGRRQESQSLSRHFNVVPWGGDGRGFELFGPDGHAFQYRIPEGRGFDFQMPGSGGRAFSMERPRLGVTVESLTDQMAEFLAVPGKSGLLVTSVEKGSPAESKLKAGDVLLKADDRSLNTPDDLAQVVRGKEGGLVELKVIRDRKEITLSVDLPKRDEGKEKRGYRL
ncbi:MAG TPA: PDZ domain-containing protein [Acidobacteriota bacterium]|nr:PDZ domain-containing protein [Acidobacteriota bacterium]